MEATQVTVAGITRPQTVYRGGDGPALVWLHGLTGIHVDLPLLDMLATSFSVYAPVCPGFDELADLGGIDSVADLAMHYDDVFMALGIDAAAVAGHSFGAMAAAELAAWYPARVSRLALVSPIGLWDDERPVADIFAVPTGELAQWLFANPSGAAATAFAAEVLDGSDTERRVALSQALTTAARFLFPIPDRGLARRLRRIAAPTLAIAGAEDRFVPPSYVADLAAGIAGARAEVLDGAGHMAAVEQPERVGELLTAFLAPVWT